MSAKDFDIIAQNEFKFLESEYNFTLSKCKKEDWGYELIYLNNTTGVKIAYEYRAAYIFIMLYQLVNGELHENPRNIEDGTIMYGYGLDDLIILCNPESLVKPAYEYGEQSDYYNEENGMRLYVNAFANNLKIFAKDILNGDFEIFADLDKIVKERAKKYR
ncbi:hypothetical protein [Pareuzebyella sediminis]|uniref:hypothetical protein n=1 Tax=Pareuzebyella sediminis TaxID=2607998 RepID=UPI0011EF3208|nr:hypothetical protein [Pareuzebyella sediminis]